MSSPSYPVDVYTAIRTCVAFIFHDPSGFFVIVFCGLNLVSSRGLFMLIYHCSPLLFVGYSFFIPKSSVSPPELANERYTTCSPVLKELPANASATCCV